MGIAKRTQKVYYVSTSGVDNTDTGRVLLLNYLWRTLNYACAQTFTDSTNFKTIKVSTGTYVEQLPIRVGKKKLLL